MVRALALVAVRQQQHDAGALAPLLLARADELVDDRLGAVDEVAELGLPEHQRVRPGHRVAVLEAQRRVLATAASRSTWNLAACPGRRSCSGVYSSPVCRSTSDRVPLAERAAAAVLADQADRVAVDQQRAEGERLAHRPVDRVLVDHRGPALQLRQQPRVRR